MALTDLGWHAGLDAAFAPFATGGLEPARVAIAYGATFRVYTEDGEELADLSGRLRHEATGRRDLPAVGDWVAVKRTTIEGGRTTIHGVLPRKSLFSRKAAGDETTEQRYLAMTWESGATPVIVLNKADLEDDLDTRRDEVQAVALGVSIHLISARERTGLEALDSYLRPGQTIAVLGSSGVGKSTLINRLLGEDRLRTYEVRESDQRGRHTTTHRELIRLPGGALLIDTPGMRELQLWSADSGVAEAFEDIAAFAQDCHFADCAHEHEPRCAVKQAVAEGRIDAARLENFHKLQRELHWLAVRQDALAQQTEKKKLRAMFRSIRKQGPSKGKP
jgi:ribosome biogenesis GTPase